MVIAKKYIAVSPFVGEPKKSDFKIVEEELPALQENEFLAEAAYISVDPYQRMKLGSSYPCDVIGGQIAKIIESKHSEYPVGTWVMGHFGWRTHTISKPENEIVYAKTLPVQTTRFRRATYLSGIGHMWQGWEHRLFRIYRALSTQSRGYCGNFWCCGSRRISCWTNSKDNGMSGRCFLIKDLNFDCAVNYKKAGIADFLKVNAPDGVDCYFDNVGGEISSTVLAQMKQYGRIAVCGAISSYNETDPDKRKATITQPFIVSKQLKMEGFLVNRFANRTMESVNQNLKWVKEGKLKYTEHIVDGFESAPDAFIGLFRGENTGKALVKVK